MERPRLSVVHMEYLHRLIFDHNNHPYTDFAEPINNKFGTKFTYYDVDRAISALGNYHRRKFPALFALDSESRHHLHFLYYVERTKETTYLLEILNKRFNKRLQFCDVEREVRVMTEFAKSRPKGYLTREEYDEHAVKEQEQHSSQPGFWKQDCPTFQYPRESVKDRELSKILGDWELPYMQRNLSDDKPIEEKMLEILNAVDTQPLADPVHSCQSIDYVRYAEKVRALQPRVSPNLTQSVIGIPTSQQIQGSQQVEQSYHGNNPKMCHVSTSLLANVSSSTAYKNGNKRKTSTVDESTITNASSSQCSKSQPMMHESPPAVHPTSQQFTFSPVVQLNKKPRLNSHPVQATKATMMATPPMTNIRRIAAQTAPTETYHNQEKSQQSITSMQYVAMERRQTYPRANSPSMQSMQRSGSAPTIGAHTSMTQEVVIDLTGPDIEQDQAERLNRIYRAYETNNYCSNVLLPPSNAQLLTIPSSQPLPTTKKNVNGQGQASHPNQTFVNRQTIYRSPTALHRTCNTTRGSDSIMTQTGLSMENSGKDFLLDYAMVSGHNGTGTFANPAQVGYSLSNNSDGVQRFAMNNGIPIQNQPVVQPALRRPSLQPPRRISSNTGSIMIGTPISQTVSTGLTRPTFTMTRPRPAPSSLQRNTYQQHWPIRQQMPHQQHLPTQQQFHPQQVTPHTFCGMIPKTQIESMQYTFDVNKAAEGPQPQQPISFPERQLSQSHIIQMQQEPTSVPLQMQNMHAFYQQEQQRQTTPRSYISETQGAQGYQGVQDYLWDHNIQNDLLEHGRQQAQDNRCAYVHQGSQRSQIGQGVQASPSAYFKGFFG